MSDCRCEVLSSILGTIKKKKEYAVLWLLDDRSQLPKMEGVSLGSTLIVITTCFNYSNQQFRFFKILCEACMRSLCRDLRHALFPLDTVLTSH